MGYRIFLEEFFEYPRSPEPRISTVERPQNIIVSRILEEHI
jgi:hypothetical protein